MTEFWKSWKFWAIVIAAILLITGIVLYFTVPAFRVAIWETAAGILLFVIGWLVGHFVK